MTGEMTLKCQWQPSTPMGTESRSGIQAAKQGAVAATGRQALSKGLSSVVLLFCVLGGASQAAAGVGEKLYC